MKKNLVLVLLALSFSSFALRNKVYIECSNLDKRVVVRFNKDTGRSTLTEDLGRYSYIKESHEISKEVYVYSFDKASILKVNFKAKTAILTKRYNNFEESTFVMYCSKARLF